MIQIPNDKVYVDVFVFVNFIILNRFFFYFFYLYLNWLHLLRHFFNLIFLIFCLSDFFNNCKSNFVFFQTLKLAVFRNRISSLFSPDYKSPSFRTLAWDDIFWSVGRRQSKNWRRRLVLRFRKVSWLGIDWLLRLPSTISNNPVQPRNTLRKLVQTMRLPTTNWSVRHLTTNCSVRHLFMAVFIERIRQHGVVRAQTLGN